MTSRKTLGNVNEFVTLDMITMKADTVKQEL